MMEMVMSTHSIWMHLSLAALRAICPMSFLLLFRLALISSTSSPMRFICSSCSRIFSSVEMPTCSASRTILVERMTEARLSCCVRS
eukprot:CAMPEP_0175537286 /NCGR_PEP_ID=MMETSP0096-20121207/25140_1 /TAXON_ID=311494 /ORGANISM="Alexandrium monilatum, Strain CCMP3105" /LENGTH=85 /DNA_ID=CAMNT_0016840117 /DNA_START=66 /DNA_END=319 /DNA_ORIENTATION=-